MRRDSDLDVLALHGRTQVLRVPFPDGVPILGASPDDERSVLADIAQELEGGGFRREDVDDGGVEFVIGGD